MKRWFEGFFYSFPVQLLVLHLKVNHLLIGMWIVLVALITGNFGTKLGIRYLFLETEYLGTTDFVSFYFVGLTFAAFYLTWNLTVYLISAHHFPFLATLSHPFAKFSLNNFVVPAAFFFFYLISIIRFQGWFIEVGPETVAIQIAGFLAGIVTAFLLYFLYFTYTNKDISHYEQNGGAPTAKILPGRRDIDLEYIKMDRNRWRVDTFLNESLQLRLVRSVAHYDSQLLRRIFRQNHLNALFLQMLTLVLLLLLGLLADVRFFRIPAACSVFLLLSIIIAFIGAITYWFSTWRATVIILLILLTNFVTSFDVANHRNKAYGMDYEAPAANYSYKALQELSSEQQVKQDMEATLAMLERWKQRVTRGDTSQKPKMVILSVSGGGLRSATWTMQVVQTADSLTRGRLLDHTVLVTGASGGLLGMAYLRELLLQKRRGAEINVHDPQYREDITRDLLNPITFSLVSSDLFLPWTRFQIGEKRYRKDRGYIFEKQLNENTRFLLDRMLWEYREPELAAEIPLLFITPSIVNDGRRLVISPIGVSYMMMAPVGFVRKNSVELDAIDFGLVFKEQDADSLRFLTALRMNATYPYILPNVHLPSDPEIEAMDAGFRDNYGLMSATRFIQVFDDWIREHTSGVELVQISSSEKIEEIYSSDKRGVITSLFKPLEIAGQILSLQEFEQDNSLGFIYDLLGEEQFGFTRFMYQPGLNNKIMASISFHITEKEKEVVLEAIEEPDNQAALRRLIRSLTPATEE